MLKYALCLSLLKFVLAYLCCGLPNDIISFFGPRLKKFVDPWPNRFINNA